MAKVLIKVLLRRWLISFLFFTVIFTTGFVRLPVAVAGEVADAQVAFGAFADELYDFAGSELTQFLVKYPHSKLAPRARLILVLCSLETGDCLKAAQEFAVLKKPIKVKGFKIDPANLQFRIGECLLRAGERQKAVASFTKVIEDHKPSEVTLRANFRLARIFFTDKNFTAAEQQVVPLLKVIDSNKNRSMKLDRKTVYWIAALTRYQLQKYAEALPLLGKINDNLAAYSLTPAERQDFYIIMIESACLAGQSEVAEKTLQSWLKIPEAKLNLQKLVPATRFTADLLRTKKRLPKIRAEMIKVAGFAIPAADKIALYELLLEIDRVAGKPAELKLWLEKLVSLLTPGAGNRGRYLVALLHLNYQLKDYSGVVSCGHQLLRENPEFWVDDKLYFPFIISLGRLDKCSEIVEYVPAALPVYGPETTTVNHQRRLVLDQLAGSCLVKLGRFNEAVTFYCALYKHYPEPVVRIKVLATLYRLAAKTTNRKKLEEWVSREVMNHFSLDRRDDEKLLKKHPELVLLVAEGLFQRHSYSKVLPSLLWLETLNLKGRLGERVTFLLAESYYRNGEMSEALARFEMLYARAGKEFCYLAALRLVTIYESQGQSSEIRAGAGKLQKLYQDLLNMESDPAVKLELQRKLEALRGLKTETTASH